MATCFAQQSSKELLSIAYLRKLRRTITYDSRTTRPTSSYKRFLSEQTDRYSCSIKYVDDEDGINKRTKRGNCIILMHIQRTSHQNDECYFR